MSAVSQGKYPRTKGKFGVFSLVLYVQHVFCWHFINNPLPPSGSVAAPRSDHGAAPPMLQTAASAAGAPLVASPYPQSYLQYNPQQYSQQQVIQAMTYPGQVGHFTSNSFYNYGFKL